MTVDTNEGLITETCDNPVGCCLKMYIKWFTTHYSHLTPDEGLG